MKNERGITLISLIMYVILITFVVAAISSITSSFYSSIHEFDNESESAVSYSKFNMYFVNDIKRAGATLEEYGDDYIILSYTNTENDETVKVEYSLQNNMLYRNKVKICENANNILITANTQNNTITINLKIKDYEKTTTYVIENFGTTNNTTEII